MLLPEEVWTQHIRSFLLAPDVLAMVDAGLDRVRDWVEINNRCADFIALNHTIEDTDEGQALRALISFIRINPSISSKPQCARFLGEVMSWDPDKTPLIGTVNGAASVDCFRRCGFLVRGWRRQFHF